jgi:hypothetical protein
MLNSDTELLFPLRVIPTLGDLRGPEWKMLVSKMSDSKTAIMEKIAFTALVAKLAGCAGCNADSFRAMRGCTQCSHQVLKRHKATDQELLSVYSDCLKEVQSYLQKREQLP